MGKGNIISRRRKSEPSYAKNTYDGELVVRQPDASENLEVGSIIPFENQVLPENIKLGNIFSNTKTTEFDFQYEDGKAINLKIAKMMVE